MPVGDPRRPSGQAKTGSPVARAQTAVEIAAAKQWFKEGDQAEKSGDCELAITKRASLSPVASAWNDAPGAGANRPVKGSPLPRALGSVCAAVE